MVGSPKLIPFDLSEDNFLFQYIHKFRQTFETHSPIIRNLIFKAGENSMSSFIH